MEEGTTAPVQTPLSAIYCYCGILLPLLPTAKDMTLHLALIEQGEI